ncbi:MAG: PEP-utilizing enzyme [Fibrobacterales bacterium]
MDVITTITDAHQQNIIGTKAYNLLTLKKEGYPVPPLFAVTTNAFNHYVPREWFNDLDEVVGRINGVPLSPEFCSELNAMVDEKKYYAVRSSAIGEDSEELSFAGQLDSFLYVKGNDITRHVKKVWASAFSDRVVEYRRINDIANDTVNVGVCVQEMVAADVSGVAFGIDPVSGNRNAVVISSVYGLGEGLVSGELDADTYTYCMKQKSCISKDIVEKNQAIVMDAESQQGVTRVSVESDRQSLSSLTDGQIKQLAETTRSISEYYQSPQDIEWAIANDTLYILQSRPITNMSNIPDKTQQKRVWDNSNITESYAGVTTPLTFSFVQKVYTNVYEQFCLIMGVEQEVVDANTPIFSMLGLMKGRIYYNLLNWYKVLSLLPGYEINASFMEQMMGVTEKIEFNPNLTYSKKNKYRRVVGLCYCTIKNLVSLSKSVTAFHVLLDATLKPYTNADYSNSTVEELIENYTDLEKKLLKKWQAPLVNDFFAMIFSGILKKLVVKWGIDSNGSLQNDLLCGEGGIVSTEPIRSIFAIVEQIKSTPRLKEQILSLPAKNVLESISEYPEVHSAIIEHCNAFGDRCVNELKLETISAKHDRSKVVQLIQSYLKVKVLSIQPGHEKRIRESAEKIVRTHMRSKLVKKRIFGWVLNKTRLLIKNRENLRFERTKLFAVVREMFLAIGQKYAAERTLEFDRDIFYLKIDEIFSFADGTAVDCNFKKIVAERKKEFEEYEGEKVPDRFETYGPVNQTNSFESTTETVVVDSSSLCGTGCSPGKIKGTVVVVTDPNNSSNLDGNIMVAEKTDPGWAPLFPLAKGILVERGSLLSHSAIVAREMGIPAVVGIKNIMTILKTGDEIEFDGTTGVVNILKRSEG